MHEDAPHPHPSPSSPSPARGPPLNPERPEDVVSGRSGNPEPQLLEAGSRAGSMGPEGAPPLRPHSLGEICWKGLEWVVENLRPGQAPPAQIKL